MTYTSLFRLVCSDRRKGKAGQGSERESEPTQRREQEREEETCLSSPSLLTLALASLIHNAPKQRHRHRQTKPTQYPRFRSSKPTPTSKIPMPTHDPKKQRTQHLHHQQYPLHKLPTNADYTSHLSLLTHIRTNLTTTPRFQRAAFSPRTSAPLVYLTLHTHLHKRDVRRLFIREVSSVGVRRRGHL